MRGWSVTLPDPGEVAARAELKYWQSLTPEQQRAERAGERERKPYTLREVDPSKLPGILARQAKQLGVRASFGLKSRKNETHVEFFDRVREACLRRRVRVSGSRK